MHTRVTLLATVMIGIALLVAGNWSRSQAAPAQASSGNVMHTDSYQRSARLDTYKVIADSGAGRGENIYFYKCWMCHNQYAKTGPYLKELFKHSQLMSGDPVTDENVAAKIKEGGPGMPAFGTTLKDADVADLITYIKEGKCCVEGENPGPNPWYRAGHAKVDGAKRLVGRRHGSREDSDAEIRRKALACNSSRQTACAPRCIPTHKDATNFPRCKPATTCCAIPTPLLFKPYVVNSVHIDGASKLDDIVLERVSDSDALPATPEIERQLSGAELLWNMPGTRRRKPRCKRIAPPATPGIRFSATATTSTAGA